MAGGVNLDEKRKALLETTALAHVATIGPNGEPQTSPVWFGWDGEHLTFSQTTNRQKYKNLKRDDRIAVSIVDPTDPYFYLEIRGRIARVDPDPDLAFINSMAKKYMGVDTYPWHQPGDERVVMVVQLERTLGMGS